MDRTHRITRRPALFGPRLRRRVGAWAALLALSGLPGALQAQPQPGAAGPMVAEAMPAGVESAAPRRRATPAIGWVVALALIVLALRQGEVDGVMEDA